ncbi:MAG: hypothetical protein JXA90_11670 [Planctomycetes bacterium]|nr:hypothetical protein [Planctomycetota bacterium]
MTGNTTVRSCAVVLLVLPALLVLPQRHLAAQSAFLRGDVNCDGCVSLLDAWDLQRGIFLAVPYPCGCIAARDANFDNVVMLADVIYILTFIVLGGPPPPAPFPVCGPAPAGAALPCAGYPACPLFKRGDADQDGCVSMADATFLLNYISLIGPAPACLEAADANDDGVLNIADPTYITAYVGAGGPAPPAPGPFVCGGDPTPSTTVGCASYAQSACCGGCKNQLPCDCNQDGMVDISDPVCMLGNLFLGTPASLPCGNGSSNHPSNVTLLDANGDIAFDMSDPIYLLVFLFSGGPAPVLGGQCVYIERCPQNTACPPFTP